MDIQTKIKNNIYYCSKENEIFKYTSKKHVQDLYAIERNNNTLNIWSDMSPSWKEKTNDNQIQ